MAKITIELDLGAQDLWEIEAWMTSHRDSDPFRTPDPVKRLQHQIYMEAIRQTEKEKPDV